jgi:hypothetical protein
MTDFNVSGQWIAHQDNGYDVHFNLLQTGHNLQGFARYTPGDVLSDKVRGTVIGDKFHVVVVWNNGLAGDYAGNFGLDTRLRGLTFEVTHPRRQANWVSNRPF